MAFQRRAANDENKTSDNRMSLDAAPYEINRGADRKEGQDSGTARLIIMLLVATLNERDGDLLRIIDGSINPSASCGD